MLEVGQIVDATVTEVRDFGLFVEVDGVPGLILIVELSWLRVRHPSAIAQAGDAVRCQILKLPDPSLADARFSASIKRCDPERDPWRDPSVYVPGATFVATITVVRDWGYWMVHPERGADVLLAREPIGGAPLPVTLAPGDTVEVAIARLDLERRTIVVDFVRRLEDARG